MRFCPDMKDIIRPSDNLTALHLASVRDKHDVVRHLALSVSISHSALALLTNMYSVETDKRVKGVVLAC